MLILIYFCENSPRIIAASGADPAVLKTGSQALVCRFLPNLYLKENAVRHFFSTVPKCLVSRILHVEEVKTLHIDWIFHCVH